MSEPRVLICGSVAFDTICVFQGKFGEHIVPEATHKISVSFMVDQMRREFGGCAGNVAYSLKLIGGSPIICATVGDDSGGYRERMEKLGIGLEALKTVNGAYTAQAYIMTDLDDNQITSFHPGAMFSSQLNDVTAVPNVALGIVSPDGRDGMFRHARGFASKKIPFIFDPGQAMPAFSGDEIVELIGLADFLTVNDYEAEMITQKTGRKIESFAPSLKALIVTLGAQGSRIYSGGTIVDVPVVPAEKLVDPTGCGDAFRAGLLYGIAHGWSVEKACKLGSLLGSIKISERGGQNHSFSESDIRARFASVWKESW
ncbi:MAG: carbohydrate kinase family protein [Betaproteobacteria bacterium]|nr:MAG: carbohydrate kinase family protein [Betaproteobacteria bacterium]